jgi:hypothetical protein
MNVQNILDEKTSDNPWTDEREENLIYKGLFSLPSKNNHYRWVYKKGESFGKLLPVYCLESVL